jgi:capsular polysaccharide biosynthesis protein
MMNFARGCAYILPPLILFWLAVCAAVYMIFGVRYIDNTIQSKQKADQLIGFLFGRPLLGMIPSRDILCL